MCSGSSSLASCSAKSPVSDQTEKSEVVELEEDEEGRPVPCFSAADSSSEVDCSVDVLEFGEMDRRGMLSEG